MTDEIPPQEPEAHGAFFAEVRAAFDARRADNLTEATDDAMTVRDWLSGVACVVATMQGNPNRVRRCLVKLATLALAAAKAHDDAPARRRLLPRVKARRDASGDRRRLPSQHRGHGAGRGNPLDVLATAPSNGTGGASTRRIVRTATLRSCWIEGAENVPATEEQIRQVLTLGKRCVEAQCLELPRWQGLVGSISKGPPTVSALRDVISTLFLYTAVHAPELGAELRDKSEQLADMLRVSG